MGSGDRSDEKKRYGEITAAVANALGIAHRHVPVLGISRAKGIVDGVTVTIVGTSAVTAPSALEHGGLRQSPAQLRVTTRHRAPGAAFRVGGLRRGRIDQPGPGDVQVLKGSPQWAADVGAEAAALVTQLAERFPGATVSNTRVKAQAVRASNQQAIALCRAMIAVSKSMDASNSTGR